MLRPPNRPHPASPDAAAFVIGCVLRVRSRAQRLLRIRAIALAIAWMLLVAVGAAAVDWSLRTPPAWFRWGLSAALLAAALTALLRLIVPTLTLRLSPVQAARRLERVFPSLDDRLSSIVALTLSQQRVGDAAPARTAPDVTSAGVTSAGVTSGQPFAAGASIALQQQAAGQLGRQLAGIDIRRAIDVRPTLRAVGLACCALAAVVLAAMLWPAAASLAARRLAMPWDDAPWPRQHALQLSPLPAAIHADTPVRVMVTDRQGALPEDTTILVRTDQQPQPRSLQAQRDDQVGRPRLVGTLRASTDDSEVWIRAVGGDDDTMPWHVAHVVRPPRLTDHRFAITPPASTGLPAYETSAAEFAVPSGSQLEFRATVDRPLQAARLTAAASPPNIAEDADGPGGPGGALAEAPSPSVTLQLSAGGTELTGELQTLRRSGTLRLALHWTDPKGIRSKSDSGWTVHITPDAPPRPQWIQPHGDLDVTAGAVIPLVWETTDDYGLVSTAVRAARGETPEEKPQETEMLFAWNAEPIANAISAAADPVLRQRREAVFRMDTLPDLAPGDWVNLRVIASDARPQQGVSAALRLNVVDSAAVQSKLVADSQQVLRQVTQARREQAIALEKSRQAASRVGDSAEQATAAADLTRLAQRAQQQAASRVDAGPSAALQTARNAVQRADVNQLSGPSIDALRQAVEQLESIRDQYLQPAADQLRQVTAAASDAATQRRLLDQIADLQAASGEALSELAEDLGSHVQADMLTEALRDAAEAQQRLVGAAARIDEATSPVGERHRLANLQRQMARENEQLAGRLERGAAAAADDGKDSAPLQQAAKALREQAIADRMREAADAMDENRVAQATSQQQEIADDLRSLAAGLQSAGSSGSPADLTTRTARLADRQHWTADQIAAVIDAQGAAAAAAARDQRQLASEAERLESDVADLPLFSDVVAQAAEAMLAAAARLDRNPTDPQAVSDARHAHVQLQAVADALQTGEQAHRSASQQTPDEQNADAQADADGASRGVPAATVRLMRSIQQQLHDTTRQLQSVDRQTLTDDQRMGFDRRRQTVARQQQWLAEQLATLLQKAVSPNGDAPSSDLPSTDEQ